VSHRLLGDLCFTGSACEMCNVWSLLSTNPLAHVHMYGWQMAVAKVVFTSVFTDFIIGSSEHAHIELAVRVGSCDEWWDWIRGIILGRRVWAMHSYSKH
jgi:hypothetical protein